ncbi:hypothetical protein CXIVA_16670 [Clostridium sp. SY8519]|uniref:single-stranded-DNA-specific exonuclease RecJ n=1 Tax=Clostridium sp. (strain SY8519) TaxID=1042156 RepID=UPI0002171C68|nr:single-stranded-DNA-specific exonuclease RecJ [Clostridium sp. SY8519]BAK47633.1 hypothetical protein CXIVA_16670 [Clostridium sp. SY8519]
MKEKWILRRKGADYAALSEALGVDPVIVRILVNKGLSNTEEMKRYLYGTRADLYDPHQMTDMDLAADILAEKIEEKQPIRIIGDYDIDGIMSSYILQQALSRCGARADVAIPDRKTDGYGLNQHLIDRAVRDRIDTILTCDNGISAMEPIAYAKQAGMTVVVTDHHQIPYKETDGQRVELSSEADAIVNPHQAGDPYPFDGLCGAGVAFKLVQVLYERMGIPVEEADEFLENAGFATIGDVMDLRDENRILAKTGLEALSHTSNLGMQALIAQNELEHTELKAHHVGFRLGPCLNASGRLDTAELSVRLLTSRKTADAVRLATEIVSLNNARKSLTEQAVEQAVQIMEQEGYTEDRVLVIFLPDCDESLAGIVAGRLRERYFRPVLVITRGEESAKGSARSIEAYSMYEEMNRCRELFLKFGGHPMAAGFSMEEDRIPELRSRLNELCTLTQEDLVPKIYIDVDMPVDYVSEELVQQLELLEPFGKGNEKPVFADRNLRVCSLRVLGEARRVNKLVMESAGHRKINAVYFGEEAELLEPIREKYGEEAVRELQSGSVQRDIRLHICYYPSVNEFRGNRTLELILQSVC